MPKVSNLYLDIDPFKIIETGFHKERAQVSESIFSLGNEYSGIRGFFDEGYSGKRLQGSYFNGIYEYALSDVANAYKGIVKRTHFTINSVNYVKTKLVVGEEQLDLNVSKFDNFKRVLDMKSGLYTRVFDWLTSKGKIQVRFDRLLNMTHCKQAIQRITLHSDSNIDLKLEMSLDNNVLHWNSDCYWNRIDEFNNNFYAGIACQTLTTSQKLVSLMHIDCPFDINEIVKKDKEICLSYNVNLKANQSCQFIRYVINNVDKNGSILLDDMIKESVIELKELVTKGYDASLNENILYFNDVWDKSDIEIGGDVKNQQGIRYCIFQLQQTYHGYAKDNNIGAKGLTGEAYSGHAFWDSETYCLPYYLFSNQEGAKNLLMYRYNTLSYAKDRAKELDCEGACYPIATRNGKEGCTLWQHASLQFQPSTAVVYAIYHYMNLYNDEAFMQDYGLEMIIEVSKFLLSRGQYNNNGTKFGFYNVMGPDEFQMMVNHNTYTNFMAKKTFDYLLSLINSEKYDVDKVMKKCNVNKGFIDKMIDASNKMVILYDENTMLFEQHDGFFDLPHIDISKIPTSEFPLYSNWSYDRIYRNDMIKQPDVLMFMFLHSSDFSYEQKKANYEFYEPKCIHESSLSPSIHSIFACELNKLDEAKKFFEFATRMDLDDYNCNTCEGIHTTSIAAAWMNIVYGFGGLRSDSNMLQISPTILSDWDYYSFKINYKGATLKVLVNKENVTISNVGKEVEIKVYDQIYKIKDKIIVENK